MTATTRELEAARAKAAEDLSIFAKLRAAIAAPARETAEDIAERLASRFEARGIVLTVRQARQLEYRARILERRGGGRGIEVAATKAPFSRAARRRRNRIASRSRARNR